MATLCSVGRISVDVVEEEIGRLLASWRTEENEDTTQNLSNLLSEEKLATLDLFDKVQLEHIVAICRRSRSLSEAGRLLYNQSRSRKSTANDADRLRKYLSRFDLSWQDLGAP
jgi:transcriptional regulatory protein RtcR